MITVYPIVTSGAYLVITLLYVFFYYCVYICRGYLPIPFYQSIFIYFFTFIFMFISFITKYLLLLSIVTLDSSNVVFFYLITAFKSEGYREFFFVYLSIVYIKKMTGLIPAILLLLICIKPDMTSC